MFSVPQMPFPKRFASMVLSTNERRILVDFAYEFIQPLAPSIREILPSLIGPDSMSLVTIRVDYFPNPVSRSDVVAIFRFEGPVSSNNFQDENDVHSFEQGEVLLVDRDIECNESLCSQVFNVKTPSLREGNQTIKFT
jgi:hypothetical protein